MEKATLAGGCFWCTEAIFKRLEGIDDVIPGYAGGKRENPSYEQIHSGATGHAESIQLTFDPKVISYKKLLEVFFKLHDPTTKDRQGNDVGPEYRSVVFYHDDKQKEVAQDLIQDLENSGSYTESIVTEVVPYTAFYPAEPEHREFYERNRTSPYCILVIDPKITKLYKEFNKETVRGLD
jgi:peptide-methionine (S)-S-oxide reductase